MRFGVLYLVAVQQGGAEMGDGSIPQNMKTTQTKTE